MKPRSPFQYNRWETDDEHIIWLPPEFLEWERKRCVYITGSRGSGKTTLLRGFEWHERLCNASLKEQLHPYPFAKRYIGVYLSMPDYITKRFINWPPRRNDMDDSQWEEEKARVYSLYLEYQILQLFIEAIQGLRGKKILKFFPEHELKTVEEILSERPEIKEFLSEETNETRLNDLRLCFKRMHEKIRFCAIKGMELQPEKGYPALQMGRMLDEIVSMLLELCSKGEELRDDGESEGMSNWTLKVCIDQIESPEQYQQKAINTIVARQVTGNTSFAIASLSGSIDINATYIPHHPLTDADRAHYSLEEVYSKETKFREFVTAVTDLRFKKFTGKNDISVDLKNLIGEWDINALLQPVLKSSENKKVREFIKRAEENIGIKFFDFKRKELPLKQLEETTPEEKVSNEEQLDEFLPEEQRIDPEIPPFYQTYLLEKLKLKLPHEESELYKIRAQKSREIRKKMVAATLCLCKEYDLSVPYAGYYMVWRMSDQCIRDFLRQMHEIYLAENTSAEKFVKRQVNPKKQNDAIRKASENRYKGISNETPHQISEVKRLVDSLGKITAEVQSAYKDTSSLKTVEKGRFYVDYSRMKSEEDMESLKDIIDIARDGHCIKMLGNFSNDDTRVLFRLHRLFAPKFEFSYRGAYSNVSIKGDDLLKLCKEKDDQKCKKIINKIIHGIIKTVDTLDNWIGDEND